MSPGNGSEIAPGGDGPAQIVFPSAREKAEFWDAYPSERGEFAARVEEGIIYTFRPRFPSLRPPKETYEGISRFEVGRDLVFWLADPKGFEQRHTATVMRAVEEFVRDRDDALAEWRQAEDEASRAIEDASRLPTAPLGFYWAYQPRKWVPSWTYRLAAG